MLPHNVKLVVWDLDETFWQGTLAEGEITPIPSNQEMVVTLAQRGIMSAISSKNDFEKAKATLEKLNVWDYFIFPKIQFSPKGKLVSEIIEQANLRAENVLFIDDLHLNREEVTHFCPGIMVADPAVILPELLALPQLTGKDDSGLTRLKQYKNLEQKSVNRAASNLETEDFLRECNIRVDIKHDIESEFDRIVELANRTNQLNFTKIRLEKPAAVEKFRKQCSTYGTSVGTIHVSDRYGDYGMVGFYMLRNLKDVKRLVHFAFSCRTMNMGIEQYVHERLGKPACRIVQPVANPIKTFKKIDWIHEGSGGEVTLGALQGSKKLVLLGGCELRQLASLCSSNRAEYVNEVENKRGIRHDDLGFILSSRNDLKQDPAFAKIFTWKPKTATRFDDDIASSSIVIASLFRILQLDYFKTAKGTWFGLTPAELNAYLRELGSKFPRMFWYLPMGPEKKLSLLEQSLDRLAELAPPGANLFALGVSTWRKRKAETLSDKDLQVREYDLFLCRKFNECLRAYCQKSSRFTFVDLDAILQEDDMITVTHFHRRGYLAIANFISSSITAALSATAAPDEAPATGILELAE
jgi:FkbH-like protein